MTSEINGRDVATIIAALRCWQEYRSEGNYIVGSSEHIRTPVK